MAGNIKGITIEFKGETTELDRSLKEIDRNTKSLDSKLKQVNKALHFNPTSVELWRQKQDLLKKKIDETKTRLDSLKQAQKKLDADDSVDKTSQEYKDLQREIITTESKLKTFKGQLQAVGNVNLRVASEQLKAIGSKATAAGHAMSGISRAAGLAVGAIGALAYKAGTAADDLNTLSKVYGIGTKELQKYKIAADLVDVEVTTIVKSHQKLKKNMATASKGTGEQAEAFKKLGIDVTNADGSLRDGDVVWQETIKALGNMKNETERDALAMILMGKSASELNPLIEDGGETYKRVSETLKKYGLDFLDQETLDKANEFNDLIDTIKIIGSAAFADIGSQLAGLFAPALGKAVEAVGNFAKWMSSLDPVVIAIATGIGGVVAMLAPALLLFGALASAAGALTGALAAVSAPALAIGAGIAALVAIFATAYARSETFRTAIGELFTALGAQLAPVVQSAIGFFKVFIAEIISTATAVADQLAPVVEALTPILTKVASIVAGVLKKAFSVLGSVIKVLGAVVKALATIFSGTFLAVIKIIKGAYTKIKGVIDNITKGFSFSGLLGKVKGIFDKVRSVMEKPVETAKNVIKGIIDKIKGFFKFSVPTPHIPLPHFNISPSGWKVGDLLKGSIPSLKVDWYAKGGIFNQPTLAGIGEAGSEAVVPLDKFWKKLDSMSGNSFNINMTVNGADDPELWAEKFARTLEMKARAF